MSDRLAHVTFLVRDYDEAVAFFTAKLGFRLIEDTPLGGGKRWVRVAAGDGSALLLAKAEGPDQAASVGKQAGGRVMFFLQTDDFAAKYAAMQNAGIRFREAPRQERYGTVAVFEDLYSSPWDLIQPV